MKLEGAPSDEAVAAAVEPSCAAEPETMEVENVPEVEIDGAGAAEGEEEEVKADDALVEAENVD